MTRYRATTEAIHLWTCEHCMKMNRDKVDPCIFCGKPKPKRGCGA